MDISELETIVSGFVLAFDDAAYNLEETARYYDRHGNRIPISLNVATRESHYAAISLESATRKGGAIAVSYLVRVGATSFAVEVTHSKTSKMREAFPSLPISAEIIAFFSTVVF